MTEAANRERAEPAAPEDVGDSGYRKAVRFICVVTLGLVLCLGLPLAEAQTLIPLHNFTGAPDGAFPEGGLVRDAAGNLYGTTTSGGRGDGTVFKIDSSGNESVLFEFDAFVSGDFPVGTLLQDKAGNLYGIAGGGPGGAGVVFKLTQAGEETILFAFQGGLENHTPKSPSGGLLMDKSGNIFGAAEFGGDDACQIGCGGVFGLTVPGELRLGHRFTGGADGSQPFGPLVRDANGNLYGVAQSGGDLTCPEFPQVGCGTVFKLSRNGAFTVLHEFAGGRDGASPQPGLLLDTAGNLYGTTGLGGNAENGTVFKIAADGTLTVLHRFTGDDGTTPNGALVSDAAHNLYGTAQTGGANGLGTAFQLSRDGTLKVLHDFEGLEDGAFPFAGLIRDEAGHLYGTTVRNFLVQQIQGGTVFEIAP